MSRPHRSARLAWTAALSLLLPATTQALEAGWRQLTVAPAQPGVPATTGALPCPTSAPARAPWVGALGHLAGGHNVIARAAGEPDLRRIAQRCATQRRAEPVFCAAGREQSARGPAVMRQAVGRTAAFA